MSDYKEFLEEVRRYRGARDRLDGVWDDERARRLRVEALGPLGQALGNQATALAQQAEQFEAAGQLSNLASRNLNDATRRLAAADDAERTAGRKLDSAKSSVATGVVAVNSCKAWCDRALHLAELGPDRSNGKAVAVAAGKAVAVEAAKYVAEEAVTAAIGQAIGADLPPGADGNTVGHLIDAVEMGYAWFDSLKNKGK